MAGLHIDLFSPSSPLPVGIVVRYGPSDGNDYFMTIKHSPISLSAVHVRADRTQDCMTALVNTFASGRRLSHPPTFDVQRYHAPGRYT
jgi:hypothetical protein